MGIGGDRDPGTDPGSDLIALTASPYTLSEGFLLPRRSRYLTSRGLTSQGVRRVFHPHCRSGHSDVPPARIRAITPSGHQPLSWVPTPEKSLKVGTSSLKPSLQQPGAIPSPPPLMARCDMSPASQLRSHPQFQAVRHLRSQRCLPAWWEERGRGIGGWGQKLLLSSR